MTNKVTPELLSVLSKVQLGVQPSMADLATLNDDDIARIATLTALETLFSPMCQETKLKATSQLLTYTKARPVARLDARITSAEKWLEDLAEASQIEDGSDDE